jgi:hypothetical protein
MRRDVIKALGWACLVTGILTVMIVVGSRRLARFDPALVAYTFASLFAVFGITARYAVWLQRPPTALFWKRGWQVFFRRGHRGRNLGTWGQRVTGEFALNNFIWRRDRLRWLAHMCIMWGCLMAAGITFPLVFGWLHFESLPDNVAWYRVYVFGFPTIAFPHDSWLAFLIFHGLVWSALLVLPGVMLAMRRRMRDEGMDGAALHLFHRRDGTRAQACTGNGHQWRVAAGRRLYGISLCVGDTRCPGPGGDRTRPVCGLRHVPGGRHALHSLHHAHPVPLDVFQYAGAEPDTDLLD